jgi:hypothetical protein
VLGPPSLERSDIDQARAHYEEILQIRSETKADIRKQAQEAADQLTEQLRIHQEEMNRRQAELDALRRIHEMLLKDLKCNTVHRLLLNLIRSWVWRLKHPLIPSGSAIDFLLNNTTQILVEIPNALSRSITPTDPSSPGFNHKNNGFLLTSPDLNA